MEQFQVVGKMYNGTKKRQTMLLGSFDTMYEALDFIEGEDYILDFNEEITIQCVEA